MNVKRDSFTDYFPNVCEIESENGCLVKIITVSAWVAVV